MTKITFWGIDEKIQTVTKRFPVTALFAVLTTFLLLWLVDGENEHLFRWPITGFLGFLAVLNWDLYTLPRRIQGWKYVLGIALIVLCLGFYFSLAPSRISDDGSCFWYSTAGICVLLHLITTVAPFTSSSPIYTAVNYNVRTFIVWMQSLLYSNILFSALSLALLALTMLFGWEPSPTAYIKLFILVTGIFQTGYFLAEMPSFEDNEYVPATRSVFKFLVGYAAVPITILYGIIVHVYLIKVLVLRESLVDWYQTMALWYIGFGALTWLLGLLYEKQQENNLLSGFRKWFLPFCIAPLATLLWSVYGQSHVGEGKEEWYFQAYFTALSAGFWVLATLKGTGSVRSIPLWFILVTSMTFFSGKFSICRYPVIAEQQQLINILKKQEILRNDTLYRPTHSLQDTNGLITSGIEYLGRKNALDFLRQYDSNHLLDSLPDTLRAVDLLTFLHVDTYNDFVDMRFWEYNRRNKDTIGISGYDRLIPGIFYSTVPEMNSDAEYLYCTPQGKALYVRGKDTMATIDLSRLLTKLAAFPDKSYDTLVAARSFDMRIVPQSATGKREGSELNITSFSAIVLVKKK